MILSTCSRDGLVRYHQFTEDECALLQALEGKGAIPRYDVELAGPLISGAFITSVDDGSGIGHGPAHGGAADTSNEEDDQEEDETEKENVEHEKGNEKVEEEKLEIETGMVPEVIG